MNGQLVKSHTVKRGETLVLAIVLVNWRDRLLITEFPKSLSKGAPSFDIKMFA